MSLLTGKGSASFCSAQVARAVFSNEKEDMFHTSFHTSRQKVDLSLGMQRAFRDALEFMGAKASTHLISVLLSTLKYNQPTIHMVKEGVVGCLLPVVSIPGAWAWFL